MADGHNTAYILDAEMTAPVARAAEMYELTAPPLPAPRVNAANSSIQAQPRSQSHDKELVILLQPPTTAPPPALPPRVGAPAVNPATGAAFDPWDYEVLTEPADDDEKSQQDAKQPTASKQRQNGPSRPAESDDDSPEDDYDSLLTLRPPKPRFPVSDNEEGDERDYEDFVPTRFPERKPLPPPTDPQHQHGVHALGQGERKGTADSTQVEVFAAKSANRISVDRIHSINIRPVETDSVRRKVRYL